MNKKNKIVTEKESKMRKWIEFNKIYFEVLMPVALTCIAIYFSYVANCILGNQTKIMEQENLPQIEIRKILAYDGQLRFTTWSIYNRGGKLSEFELNVYSFLTFTHNYSQDTLMLPVYNYIPWTGTPTGESEGLLLRFDNSCNSLKENHLKDSLMLYGHYDVRSYMIIYYTDIFDKKHKEYFEINPYVTTISKETWEDINSKFETKDNYYNFTKLDAINVIEKARNVRPQSSLSSDSNANGK